MKNRRRKFTGDDKMAILRRYLVQWNRPAKLSWMDAETYDRMPESIEVREIHVHVGPSGFRPELFVVVTTLTGAILLNLSGHLIGDRPGRLDPRAVKRRPKPHDRLTKPRVEARAELRAKNPS